MFYEIKVFLKQVKVIKVIIIILFYFKIYIYHISKFYELQKN